MQITNVHLLPDTLKTIDGSSTSQLAEHCPGTAGTYQISFGPIEYATESSDTGALDALRPLADNVETAAADLCTVIPLTSFDMITTAGQFTINNNNSSQTSFISSSSSSSPYNAHPASVRATKVTFEQADKVYDDCTNKTDSLSRQMNNNQTSELATKRLNIIGKNNNGINNNGNSSNSNATLTTLNEEDDEM